MSKYYVRTDKDDIIIEAFNDAFVQPKKKDICVNEDCPRNFKIDIVDFETQVFNCKLDKKRGVVTLNNKEFKLTKYYKKYLLFKTRILRDELLNECDNKYCNAEKWHNMTDKEKSRWSIYKQKLRDITKAVELQGEIKFPALPTGDEEE